MTPDTTYTEDEAMSLAWAMYQLGTEHQASGRTRERDIIDDYANGYLAAIRGARREATKTAEVEKYVVRYKGDIHADVPENAETVAARINELHLAIWTVEECGCDPLLTDVVNKLGERMRKLRLVAPKYIQYDPL